MNEWRRVVDKLEVDDSTLMEPFKGIEGYTTQILLARLYQYSKDAASM